MYLNKFIYIFIYLFIYRQYTLFSDTQLHGFLSGYASMPPSILSQRYFPLELVAPEGKLQWKRLLHNDCDC